MSPAVPEQRYLLAVAYEPGKQDRIAKGKDGGRDFFTEVELEKAAFSFIPGGAEVGMFHLDGTVGHVQVVESYIYRGPPWTLTAVDGSEQVIKAGTWLVGLICDEVAWHAYKDGLVGGLSPQGKATRRRRIG